MKVERFEDIKAWQEAEALARTVHNVVKSDKGFFIQCLLSKEEHPGNLTDSNDYLKRFTGKNC